MKPRIIFTVFLLLTLLTTSCNRIKEDRDNCPITTVVLKADPALDVSGTCYVRFWKKDFLGEGGAIDASLLNTGYLYYIEKNTSFTVAALIGWPEGEEWSRGNRYTIPDGQACPEAYTAYGEAFLTEDEQTVPLTFKSLSVPVSVNLDGGLNASDYILWSDIYGYEYPKMGPLSSTNGHHINITSSSTRVPRLDEERVLIIKNTKTGKQADIIKDALIPGGYDFSSHIQKEINIHNVDGNKITISFETKSGQQNIKINL